jgi:predicted house-cleaning noncanonical NTP pyrophosphatase (MazG superfamily)
MDQLIIDPYDLFSVNLKPEKYGNKGLSLIPIKNFTPKFYLISTELYQSFLKEDFESFTKLCSIIKSFLSNKFDPTESLLIRSSSTIENLQKRGKYLSIGVDSTEKLNQAINEIFKDFEKSKDQNEEIGIIIQRKIDFLIKGHLSNERRLAKKETTWTYEIEESKVTSRVPNKKTFIPKKTSSSAILRCENFDSIMDLFDIIGSKFTNKKHRVHLEWLYEEKRLYLVQLDIEEEELGAEPASMWKPLVYERKEINELNFFTTNYGNCKKTECLNTFQSCNLPSAKIFILNNASLFDNILNDKISNEFKDEIQQILSYPIVIRTDIATDDNNFLLPRTDTVFDVETAIRFIRDTLVQFNEKEIPKEKIYFLIHRYISSKASALAFASPNTKKVKIDSIWGLPDGLHCFPYDSFEISIGTKLNVESKESCKEFYLDCNEQGIWKRVKSGWNIDWKSSLNDEQINRIAQYTLKISQSLNESIAVMFFVDVDKNSGHPSILPWFYTNDIPTFESQPVEIIFPTNEFILTNNKDFEILRNINQSNLSVKLQLSPEVIRNRDFINSVADFLALKKIPTILEGSLLSHVFYILTNRGVNLKCTDPFKPKYDKITYNKLVRDKIPDLISSQGEKVSVKRLNDYEHIELLKLKLLEESLELNHEKDSNKLLEEAADVYEVLLTLINKLNFSFDELAFTASKKRDLSGGFKEGIYLIKTQDLALIEKGKENLLHYESKVDYSKTNKIKHQETEDELFVEIPIIPPLNKSISKKLKNKNIHIKYLPQAIQITFSKPKIPNSQPTLFDKLPLTSGDDIIS